MNRKEFNDMHPLPSSNCLTSLKNDHGENIYENSPSTELSILRIFAQSKLQENQQSKQTFGSELILRADGTPLIDHNNNPIPIDKFLATKPLKCDLSTRPGPGNRKLTYMSGDSVTRTLNEVFGFDGWCLEIKDTKREECVKDDRGRHHVSYTTIVRLTHRRSNSFREDCGAGDAIDKSLGNAVANALKASVTDAIKRAARHFGDKLGNSLYQGNFTLNKAPNTLQEACDMFEIEQAKTKFGFEKDRMANKEINTNCNGGSEKLLTRQSNMVSNFKTEIANNKKNYSNGQNITTMVVNNKQSLGHRNKNNIVTPSIKMNPAEVTAHKSSEINHFLPKKNTTDDHPALQRESTNFMSYDQSNLLAPMNAPSTRTNNFNSVGLSRFQQKETHMKHAPVEKLDPSLPSTYSTKGRILNNGKRSFPNDTNELESSKKKVTSSFGPINPYATKK